MDFETKLDVALVKIKRYIDKPYLIGSHVAVIEPVSGGRYGISGNCTTHDGAARIIGIARRIGSWDVMRNYITRALKKDHVCVVLQTAHKDEYAVEEVLSEWLSDTF